MADPAVLFRAFAPATYGLAPVDDVGDGEPTAGLSTRKASRSTEVPFRNGPRRDRTCDPLIKSSTVMFPPVSMVCPSVRE
jgi:hypothetical protein